MRFELDFPIIEEEYTTDQRTIPALTKSFPSLSFYRRMVRTVWKASRLAKRGKYDDHQWCKSSYDIFQALEHIGTTIEVRNLKRLTELQEPCIIIGNHMSTLETFLLPYLICPKKKLTFVVKEALISYPVFKHVMISRSPIVVGRDNPKKDFLTVLNEGVARIKDGFSVVVFPQTTRMTEFDKTQFNSIGIKLAKRAKAPVVPLALKTDCWGNGAVIKDFGKIDPAKNIHFDFGSPLEIEGNGKIQQEAVISHIENCLSRWRSNNRS